MRFHYADSSCSLFCRPQYTCYLEFNRDPIISVVLGNLRAESFVKVFLRFVTPRSLARSRPLSLITYRRLRKAFEQLFSPTLLAQARCSSLDFVDRLWRCHLQTLLTIIQFCPAIPKHGVSADNLFATTTDLKHSETIKIPLVSAKNVSRYRKSI